MGINQLAEGIVLQSIEDLWDAKFRKGGIDFLRGEGLTICADLAGMNLYDQVILINMTDNIVKQTARPVPETLLSKTRQKQQFHRADTT